MRQLIDEHKGLLGQLIRFGMVGGFVTGLYAIVYSPLAKFGILSPQLANLAGYFVAMVTGYVLHSRWSFRDHGTRDNTARTTGRFFVVSLVSLGLNALFVFILTDSLMLGGPWWWPLIPILFVTPLVTFSLNRLWVFA
jgi:putative flippase GtrA